MGRVGMLARTVRPDSRRHRPLPLLNAGAAMAPSCSIGLIYSNRPESPCFQAGDEWRLLSPTPGCYTAYELSLSPWGIMAWGATPRSSRLQSGEMSHCYSLNAPRI